ncbi:MAG TPA: hypothetical protein VGR63_04205 [Casimicrobiaceae bacterium]|nr:hypothetical protein [Casimicrobiaceae bacterium]
MTTALQPLFDVGIVVPTIVRPSLVQAVRSIYAQRFGGRIQILIGIDRWVGERALLEQLVRECPSHMSVTTLDLGYSTSQRHGGVYPSHYGGALKTILSYAANSRYVAYLDDDNYYAPQHVATMVAAVAGKAWGFALRHFVDDNSDRLVCVDTWESVGPGRGVYRTAHGGFVDTNCYFLDTLACADVFPEWALTRYPGGTGGDRQVLEKLRDRPFGSNGAATVYYRIRLARQHPYQLWQMKRLGVDLAALMAPGDIPGDAVWQRCADFDRRQRAASARGDARGAA